MADQVKLIGAKFSPYSCRVEIALNLKGIKYEFIEEDLGNKSDLLLKYNPLLKKIPVLVHNGKPIAESSVIVEYIDETWPNSPSILPHHPYDKAISRFWAKFVNEKVLSSVWNACWTKGEKQGKAIEDASENLKKIEDELKDKKFFGGDSIGYVDIMMATIAFWSPLIQEVTGNEVFTGERFPKLYEWAEEFVNCKDVKEYLPPKEILIEFFGAILNAPETLTYHPQVPK